MVIHCLSVPSCMSVADSLNPFWRTILGYRWQLSRRRLKSSILSACNASPLTSHAWNLLGTPKARVSTLLRPRIGCLTFPNSTALRKFPLFHAPWRMIALMFFSGIPGLKTGILLRHVPSQKHVCIAFSTVPLFPDQYDSIPFSFTLYNFIFLPSSHDLTFVQTCSDNSYIGRTQIFTNKQPFYNF